MILFAIIISSLLAILSHPTVIAGYVFPPLSFLAWIAYLPLFFVVVGQDYKTQFKRVFLFCFLFNGGVLHWLYIAMNQFGHLSPAASVLGLLILMAIFSLHFTLAFLLSRFFECRLRVPVFWSLPLLWVSAEWLRNCFPFKGYPWAQAGYSQAFHPALIQIADLTGVYGITALILWVNLAVFEGVQFLRKQVSLKQSIFRISFVILLWGMLWGYGQYRLITLDPLIEKASKVKVALLQGNISQDEKWLSSRAEAISKIYQRMTEAASSLGAELTIWPEASYPHELALEDVEQLRRVGDFSVDVMIGAVTHSLFDRLSIQNSAFLLHPDQTLGGAYHKQHLVPYGEYVPLRNFLPFLEKLTAQVGDFSPGKAYTLLHSGSAQIGSLICYEDIFPEIARGHVLQGANLLVNISNDAWYGNSSALPQHLSYSPFRSVENRRSLVRATNTGITATFDPLGRLQKVLVPFQRDILIDAMALMTQKTFYVKWGDVFSYFCIALTLIMFILALCRKKAPIKSNL